MIYYYNITVVKTGWLHDIDGITNQYYAVRLGNEAYKKIWCLEALTTETVIQLTLENVELSCFAPVCSKRLEISDSSDSQSFNRFSLVSKKDVKFTGTVRVQYEQRREDLGEFESFEDMATTTTFSIKFKGNTNIL